MVCCCLAVGLCTPSRAPAPANAKVHAQSLAGETVTRPAHTDPIQHSSSWRKVMLVGAHAGALSWAQRKPPLASSDTNASKQKQTIFWTDFETGRVRSKACVDHMLSCQSGEEESLPEAHYQILSHVQRVCFVCYDLKLQRGALKTSLASDGSKSACELFRHGRSRVCGRFLFFTSGFVCFFLQQFFCICAWKRLPSISPTAILIRFYSGI